MNNKEINFPNNLVSDNHSASKVYNSSTIVDSIVESLLVNYKKYQPEDTISKIDLMNKHENAARFMYSKISKYLMDENSKSNGEVNQEISDNIKNNIIVLVEYIDGRDSVSKKCKNIIFNIYDHVELTSIQLMKFNKIYNDTLKEQEKVQNKVKEDLEKSSSILEEILILQEKNIEEVNLVKKEINKIKEETRGIQKEQIAILGIFSGVVLTFVGGIVVSNSILQNADKIDIHKLILILDMLAIFLINFIHMMFKFVWRIQSKDEKDIFFGIYGINTILVVIFLLCLLYIK